MKIFNKTTVTTAGNGNYNVNTSLGVLGVIEMVAGVGGAILTGYQLGKSIYQDIRDRKLNKKEREARELTARAAKKEAEDFLKNKEN